MATIFWHSLLLRRPCIKHFSHSHPLRPVDVKEEEELVCSGCELDLSGSAYKCSKSNCEFSLHKSCFELPGELEHNTHSQHLLTLLPSPPKHDSKFTCDACGDYGTVFTYHANSISMLDVLSCPTPSNMWIMITHLHSSIPPPWEKAAQPSLVMLVRKMFLKAIGSTIAQIAIMAPI
ncbi:hypothetical protein MANES_09G038700v8 [Manihot esculenta]|uniref:Uncharacterized protein n=1 Tax=Manihot esculenta TaxID=3983 RepID=A0ACB7H2G2_MANES|nr:hypothetical protein MANES_09G038700v8 [Manihot esculenta]